MYMLTKVDDPMQEFMSFLNTNDPRSPRLDKILDEHDKLVLFAVDTVTLRVYRRLKDNLLWKECHYDLSIYLFCF